LEGFPKTNGSAYGDDSPHKDGKRGFDFLLCHKNKNRTLKKGK